MNYESVIGLEIHIQLKTKSKIWCSSEADYDDKEPNTCITPTSVGLPGALPFLNEEVLNYAIKAALALNCEINELSYFDRKNYFYPDSPKNYQITQYFKPYAQNGYIEINGRKIEIERIQIEEDTAKSIHLGNQSLLNFNRASIPLLEIITKPVIKNSNEAYEFLNALKQTIKYTKISDVSMELGSLRCDANVSVKKVDDDKLGTRTETKNLNSFKAVAKAIDYEINRQIDVLEKGGKITQETRTWDEEKGVTRVMRSKEDAMDYRYFPDPDLPAVLITKDRIEHQKSLMPEFPQQKIQRFITEYDLSQTDASILVNDLELSEYFENTLKLCGDAKLSCNWILTEVLRVLKENNYNISDFSIRENRLAQIISLIKDNTISSKIAKQVFEIMLNDDRQAIDIIKEKGLLQVTDLSEIEKIVDEVLAQNEQAIIDLKNGKDRALKHLMGQAMKLSKGKANPKIVTDMIMEKCNNEN